MPDPNFPDPTAVDVTAPATPVVPVVPGGPSWLTGEFYVALAPLVAGLITVATGRHVVTADVQAWLVGGGTVVVGLYAAARTLLKAIHVHSAATVARAQALAAAKPAAANLDAVAAVAARHAVDPSAIASALVDELDRRFVLTQRRKPRAR